MKLNNRGWGLGVFLGFVALLLACIIVAGVNAYKVGLSSESPKDYFDSVVPTPTSTPTNKSDNNYLEMEEDIIEAARIYKNDYYSDLKEDEDAIVVTFKKLVELDYLNSAKDCSGYVEIKNENQDINYSVYFNCSNYVTEGYNHELDK